MSVPVTDLKERARNRDQQRVTVGRCVGRNLTAQRSARARAILDDDLLPEHRTEPLRQSSAEYRQVRRVLTAGPRCVRTRPMSKVKMDSRLRGNDAVRRCAGMTLYVAAPE
jgi:hypothetical protein